MQHESKVRAWNGAALGWWPRACVTQSGRKNCFLAQCLLAILLEKCYFSAGVIILARVGK
jgi:hypothetical protein